MPSPVLHYTVVGDENAPRRMFVLHGIYGTGRNWATLARKLSATCPEWAVVLVDLRLHGRSRGFAPPHTLATCVHDLVELADQFGNGPDAILGHSFGGKVALMAGPILRPAQVWVIDSTPSRRTPGGGAQEMLQILRRLPDEFTNRTAGVTALQEEGLATPVAHWMATNLEREGDRFRWRFDLDDMQSLLDDFFRRDLWDVVETPPAGTSVYFVRASGSDVLPSAELERIRDIGSPSVHGFELRGGHWLHEDNPQGLLDLLAGKLHG